MAQFLSHTDLITQSVRRLRQVPGLQTQLYSEMVISSYIEECYYSVRQEAWWPWLMKRVSGTLDGVTGTVVGTPWSSAGLKDFEDIRAVYYESYQQRLPKIGEDVNPDSLLGNVARYFEPLTIHSDPVNEKLFKVYPVTMGGIIRVWARCDPVGLFSNPAIVVPMDRFMILNYVMWRYMTDDAANPGAAAAALQAFNRIKEQQLSNVNDEPIWLNPDMTELHNEWQERG